MKVISDRWTARLPVTLLLTTLCLAPNADGGAELAGSEWRPLAIGELEVPADPEMFVRFGGDGKLEGHGGCNRFFGSYTLTGDAIEIGPIGATRMACPAPVMEHETLFLQALENARLFSREQIDLQLFDASGETIIVLVQTDAD